MRCHQGRSRSAVTTTSVGVEAGGERFDLTHRTHRMTVQSRVGLSKPLDKRKISWCSERSQRSRYRFFSFLLWAPGERLRCQLPGVMTSNGSQRPEGGGNEKPPDGLPSTAANWRTCVRPARRRIAIRRRRLNSSKSVKTVPGLICDVSRTSPWAARSAAIDGSRAIGASGGMSTHPDQFPGHATPASLGACCRVGGRRRFARIGCSVDAPRTRENAAMSPSGP